MGVAATTCSRAVLIVTEGARYLWVLRNRRGFPWGLLPIPPRPYIAWRLHTAYGPATLREVVKLVGVRQLALDASRVLMWLRRMRIMRELS